MTRAVPDTPDLLKIYNTLPETLQIVLAAITRDPAGIEEEVRNSDHAFLLGWGRTNKILLRKICQTCRP